MQYYVKLNKAGRKKILEMMDDYVQLEKYQMKE
ncbi:MAG TPA: transcriptional regulator, partial [Lachnospiraceae bacterium]|nr:transcriptional regulator [Lachnospiraceae bacterium]